MEDIGEFSDVETGVHRPTAELLAGYSYLAPGDIAYAKVTPCFENGKGIGAGVIHEATFATTELTVLRPMNGADARFLEWVVQSSVFRGPAIAAMTGAGGLRRVPESVARDLAIPVPSPSMQREIADYLDHETTEIDAFLADLAKTHALTRERLVSEWARLFSEAMSAPPTQIRHVVTSLVDGPFGSGLTSAHYADRGAPVVRLGNIGRNRFEIEPRVYVSRAYAAELSAHAVSPGDVVIAGLGDANHPLGRAAVVPVEFGAGIVKADCYRARVNQRVSASFLAWSLSAPQTTDSFREMSRGSTRSRLNLAVVAATSIPVPDQETQHRLVMSYRDAEAIAASALQEVEAAIALAKERRAALITAAITGQIEVTAGQAPVVHSVQSAIKETR